MGKLRIQKNYGITPNEILNNPNISIKAKGMFGYLQSKPDGWAFSEARILSQMKEGRVAIHSTIKELEEAGYLQRVPVKNKKGQWDGYDYILYENPFDGKPAKRKTRQSGDLSTLSKKDISNKDNSKKDIDINKENKKEKKELVPLEGETQEKEKENSAKEREKEIAELISYFEPINPTTYRLYGNSTQRKAMGRMLDKFGFQKMKQIIKFLPKIVGEPYAPTITTPYQLEYKMAQLISFTQKLRKEKSKTRVINLDDELERLKQRFGMGVKNQ